MSNSKLSSPEEWVDLYGDALLRFCLAKVRKVDIAEELVQEAFLAALKSQNQFRGESTEKTWLIGILKHKILDHFRKVKKEQPISQFQCENEDFDDWFDEKGMWKKAPKEWLEDDPKKLFEKKEFWSVFNICIENLAEQPQEVYLRKEIDREATESVCKSLEITATNLWVILHRARSKLRNCLEERWFAPKEQS